jgi:WbqC-like protein family
LRSRERVIDIAKLANAAEYVNAIGGQGLYDKDLFRENGIKLSFLRPLEIVYQQFAAPFVPDLSIIDVLMFNSTTEVEQMLTQFELV